MASDRTKLALSGSIWLKVSCGFIRMRKLKPIVPTLSLGLAALAAIAAACDSPKPEGTAPVASGSAATPTTTLNAGNTGDAGAHAKAAKGAEAEKETDAGYTGPTLGALNLQTPVMSEMEWPKDDPKRPGEKIGSMRIGYIRQGSRVPVIAEAHPKSNCKEGWYELVQGGFVCGKYATLETNHPRLRMAPHAPDTVGSLPYQYGYNIANGTPLYRNVPSHEERMAIEPWLDPKKKKKEKDESAESAVDGGSLPPITLARASVSASADEGDAGTPWYMRSYDGGKPQVTLDDLKGEGPVSRRMVKGFFLALDKNFGANGGHWWRTTGGLLAPAERIYVHKTASDFHGLWMESGDANANAKAAPAADGGAETPAKEKKPIEALCKPGSKAQIGIITQYKSKKYIVSLNKKSVTTGDSVSRHTVIRLTGDSVTIGGTTYDETEDGWWMKAAEGTKTHPGDPPKDLKKDEKWIDVNVTRQTLVAYEGDRPVFATAVSTGLVDKEDKEKDHHTPPGTFRIREKHIAATMDGDVASDGPYSIEDVPWIMYFQGSYALHGAFWHNNFGRTKSHGCVNLAPADAKALFAWTEPRLPEGWHGVMSTPERPGTRVVVHE